MSTSLDFSNNNRVTDFTTEVKLIDNQYSFVDRIINFTERNTQHTNITFDITDKQVVIPHSNTRGAKDFTRGQERSVKPISIFLDYIREEDLNTKNDFQDYRLPGTADTMDKLTAVRMDKFSGLVNNIENSIEYKRLSAITGTSYNAYGEVQADLYTATGTTQDTKDLVLGTAATDVGGLLNDAVRTMTSNYRMGSRVNAAVCFCSDTLFDAILKHEQVRESLVYDAATSGPLRNSNLESEIFGSVGYFTFKGILFVNYNPDFNVLDANGRAVTTVNAIAEGDGYLMPRGAAGMFDTYWGPSQELNKVEGSRVHAREYISDDKETWKVIVENADLHFCTNPKAIIRLFSSN